ncbi:helix-turn-helix transcriptional regulator [Hydrogenophaga sp. 2FB]|uniref:helix-turn-helix domain-containing protein n=1 Tax=Hydrogenophaga sp. 2FB TaxID=2502187 RepID=UPI0010F77D1E|nr:helix-turn-helix transcriptional regulator [Hydrogenophaga sp. 2FB]
MAQTQDKEVPDFLPHITTEDLDQAGEWSLAAIGRHIKKARIDVFHVTQDAFAAKLGISHVTLRKMEKGDPSLSAGTYFRALALMRRTKTIAQAADYYASDTLTPRGSQGVGLMAPAGLAAPAAPPSTTPVVPAAATPATPSEDLGTIVGRFTSGQRLARPR